MTHGVPPPPPTNSAFAVHARRGDRIAEDMDATAAAAALSPWTLRSIDSVAQSAWQDFLSNKVELAAQRAAAWLHVLPALIASGRRDADALATLGDLHHIAGAARRDPALLESALGAYDAVLALRTGVDGLNALRMRAETLLRLRRYADAFDAFDRLHELRLRDPKRGRDLEIAPFRLVHDAEAIEANGRTDEGWPEAALAWRQLAAELVGGGGDGGSGADQLKRTAVRDLSAAQRSLLGPAYGQPLPLPAASASPPPPAERALRERPAADWAALEAEYASSRAIVLDGVLGDEALRELQLWSRHGAHFDTMRAGYLGAFPGDGTTHPLLLKLADELASALPAAVGPHALGLWWLFKHVGGHSHGEGVLMLWIWTHGLD